MKDCMAANRLKELAGSMAGRHLRDLFDNDPGRFEKFSLKAGPLLLDFSKNRIDGDVLDVLIDLARARGVEERRARMFAGDLVNETEKRAALHVALRAPCDAEFETGGAPVMADIHRALSRMERFSASVRSGALRGQMGRAFSDVVNIGIGGSDLGPAMAVAALSPYHDGPRCHFVSNVDGAALGDTLKRLDPETTLFLVASKTFTTQETMMNARSAREWLVEGLGEEAVPQHFAAISAEVEKAMDFGIHAECVFGFWDWVGGRYSVWSAIGLSVMLAIGPCNFRAFLDGAHAMDRHFETAPLQGNMPVLLAMLGVWYRNFMGYATHAVLPYDERLARFPAYLQQLDMESNGKRTGLDGAVLDYASGPVVWGASGTNGQHAFFQFLHQGTDAIPCDFLLAARPHEAMGEHHAVLAANCFAQAEALMRGRTLAETKAELAASGKSAGEVERLAPHKVFPGNRPSNLLLYERLDPYTLGSLIALYEHKIFVQGAVWGVNPFDQWGVELGKTLAASLLPALRDGADAGERDTSTKGLIAAYRHFAKERGY